MIFTVAAGADCGITNHAPDAEPKTRSAFFIAAEVDDLDEAAEWDAALVLLDGSP